MLGISKKEAMWYLFVGIITLINEIGIEYGFAVCTFGLSMLFMLWLGLKTFPPKA
jgi:hypothetical protein